MYCRTLNDIKDNGIKDEDLLLMILELYTSVATCFAIKVISKNKALF